MTRYAIHFLDNRGKVNNLLARLLWARAPRQESLFLKRNKTEPERAAEIQAREN